MPLRVTRRRGLLAASALAATWIGACGARTPVEIPPPAELPPECVADEECPGFGDLCAPVKCLEGGLGPLETAGAAGGKCVVLPAVDCDDNDPCTTESCEPAAGECSYAPGTLDSSNPDAPPSPR